ncbi:Shikimate dehydrogenase (NADP(+)) [Pleomorphomonas sp. T1.2MG-36]|uniref:shikimate dehydrogenase n=1 Tax=Pleomorphomonas sp. T1.2MG-36 TaxID=3041167 RepID=UPI002477619F|nr:shikimate dehydrogenase [Pleomorphomonas sp. T1.2MG-36]CAI9401572.1 Shikimate dehydrogenase (NADP(+)) [Pleomorphomonas sp. T1.2MG-36]
MPAELNFLSLLTGCFATPVAENPTVAMVEAAYRAMGLDARYINCDVAPADLGNAVRGARAMGWRGFNCSLPHKVAVIDFIDEFAPSAEIIGAVNCVINDDGKLIGENTDGKGFLTSLETVIDPRGKRVVVLGAGGASRAIAIETALAGAASIAVVNRDEARGKAVVQLVAAHTSAAAEFVPWTGSYIIPEETDILINATSIGLFPGVGDLPAVDFTSVRPGLVVADVIPNPPHTAFLRMAETHGAITLDGLGMLVNQGVIGIRLWTGREPDAKVMRGALEAVFGA